MHRQQKKLKLKQLLSSIFRPCWSHTEKLCQIPVYRKDFEIDWLFINSPSWVKTANGWVETARLFINSPGWVETVNGWVETTLIVYKQSWVGRNSHWLGRNSHWLGRHSY